MLELTACFKVGAESELVCKFLCRSIVGINIRSNLYFTRSTATIDLSSAPFESYALGWNNGNGKKIKVVI